MLYELAGIARVSGNTGIADARDVCRLMGKLIVNNRGVIRQLNNVGIRQLPRIINKNRQSHIVGAHFYVQFDASPGVQAQAFRMLRKDPRIIRSTMVRVGNSK